MPIAVFSNLNQALDWVAQPERQAALKFLHASMYVRTMPVENALCSCGKEKVDGFCPKCDEPPEWMKSEDRLAIRKAEMSNPYREPGLSEYKQYQEEVQRIKSLVDEYLQYRNMTRPKGVVVTELTYIAALSRADRLIIELSEFKFWNMLEKRETDLILTGQPGPGHPWSTR